MGTIESFTPAKLIMGVITAPCHTREEIVSTLEPVFGQTDYIGDIIPFDFTSYYTEEMGSALQRFFLAFLEPVSPVRLVEFKHLSNRTEERFAREGKRAVNLDPGILTLHSLILASTKDHSHRIPLSEGIYGEVTLLYTGGRFDDLPWTYPDYRTPVYKAELLKIRTLFRDQLKQEAR